jgi:3-methyladenine DNA glycosylase AlkD
MTASEVLELLESKQEKRGIEQFNNLKLKGLYSFGIGVTKLRAIAKSIKTNHDLAMELVETECFDAIILSSMIADPKK